ncbi:MAG: trimethylamine methyltransferase family protein [Rhodobacteraceae bacterium]|nr:trimethylamine methyltransferase family protein [Paracoccaceae bacterium]MCY4250590.1 trimethylamine methyltransferase family protein [Paracoccaceae bacterium]
MPNRRRGRSGGRSANIHLRSSKLFDQMPWRIPYNPDKPTEPLDEEGILCIHETALQIMENIGIEFLNEEARTIFKEAGCKVEGTNVRLGRDFVMEMIKHCPEEFTITPRNPDRELIVGGKHMLFGCVSSPPNTWDLENGKQVGNQEYFRNFLKLAQYFNCIHFVCGYPVEPVDIHPSIRHLDCLYDKLTMTDKVAHAYSLGRERVEDVMEMVRIASGLTHEEFDEKPRMFTNINSTSPLKHDWPMIDGSMRLARRGQPVIVSPFTLAGAMAPVSMAGAVALSMAEGLAAIALLEYINPGTPIVFGTFTSNVDLRSGAPAFGTPEYVRATQMAGQMCRFYGLPLRASNACAANVPDGQAMWESMNSMWSAVQSQVNMVYHSAGWLEGGLISSPEKFIMDCETLQQFQRYFEKTVYGTEEKDLALEAISEVGSSGHFFGVQHTQERYTTAFYEPFLSNWQNYEAFELGGGVWTTERAHKLYKQILDDFKPPAVDPAIDEELAEFVERRKAEGGAATDF